MQSEVLKEILKKEYVKRNNINPAYSMRAFSNYLGIGIASLSDCFNDKRQLSKRNSEKIIDKLELSPEQRDAILNFKPKEEEGINQLELAEDQFQVISDWYHSAIMELALVKGQKSAPEWIANKLGISKLEVEMALKRLERLGLLTKRNGKLSRKTKPVKTTTDIPSSAIRKHHKQIFEMAKVSIENDPVDKRHFWSIVMAINPKQIPKAKEMLIKAGRRICKTLETGTPKEVYALNTGLFPLKKRKH